MNVSHVVTVSPNLSATYNTVGSWVVERTARLTLSTPASDNKLNGSLQTTVVSDTRCTLHLDTCQHILKSEEGHLCITEFGSFDKFSAKIWSVTH